MVVTPVVVPVQPTLTGCALYESYINKYEWDKSVARAIMHAESNCNTNAVGDNRVIGGIYAPSCGLMQIRTLAGRPSCEELKNPETNVAWAYRLYSANGFQPWSVYNNGAYLKYM